MFCRIVSGIPGPSSAIEQKAVLPSDQVWMEIFPFELRCCDWMAWALLMIRFSSTWLIWSGIQGMSGTASKTVSISAQKRYSLLATISVSATSLLISDNTFLSTACLYERLRIPSTIFLMRSSPFCEPSKISYISSMSESIPIFSSFSCTVCSSDSREKPVLSLRL